MVTVPQGLRSRKVPPPVLPPKKVTLDGVIERLRSEGRPCDETLLRSVYDFSAEMHRDQTRQSGEPFLTHPLQVAYLLAGFRADQISVTVGLLHDVLEDTLTTREALAVYDVNKGTERWKQAGKVTDVITDGNRVYLMREYKKPVHLACLPARPTSAPSGFTALTT